MYLTKSSGKSPYYQILYKNNFGKLTTKSTKKKSKSDALKFLAEFKESLKEKERLNPVTLKDFECEYLQLVNSIRSKSYIRSIKTSFKRLSDFIGNPILNEVDHRDLEKFFTSVFSESKYAAAMYFRTLKAAFEKAKAWNYISENPFKKFKLPKLPKTLPVFIDYQQLKKILDFTVSELMKAVFQTAFFTGLRLSELINLRWTAVDFKNMIIKVENSNSFTTKNKKERIIPINKTLYNILIKRYPKIIDIKLNDFVFSRVQGIPLNNFYVSKSFKKSVRKSKLDERIHFHSLRHSFASGLVQKGVSIYVVKELLGHQDITTTQIYAHIKNENLFDAVRTLEPANMEKQKNVTK